MQFGHVYHRRNGCHVQHRDRAAFRLHLLTGCAFSEACREEGGRRKDNKPSRGRKESACNWDTFVIDETAAKCKVRIGAASRLHLLTGGALPSLLEVCSEDGASSKGWSL
mgnify:CR=1 FL=1